MTHAVVAGLRDPDASVRQKACLAAPEDPSAVLLVDALGEALADPEPRVARAASDALAKLAPDHPAVAELLRRALHADDPHLRWGAAFTKARLAPPEPGLLPALAEALASPRSHVRWSAARILVDLGRLHREALPVALGLARTDPNPVVRRMALFCARELAPHEPATADAMLEASRDPDRRVRRGALASMAALVDPPPDITEHLNRTLEDDPDPGARRLAEAALAVARDQKIRESME